MCEFCKNIGIGIPDWDFLTPDENGRTPSGVEIEIRKIVGKRALVFTNSANEYGAGALNINYCPICGKRLTKEEKDPLNICKTNPDCDHNPEECGFSINCTTIEDSIQGKESYVCGFEPCIYAKRRN